MELGDFLGRIGDFTTVQERLDTAKDKSESFDPINIWNGYPGALLTRVARALLSITASEAAVERSFSAQDAVHTKRRNRLLDESVQMEMFVKFNYRALDKSSIVHHEQRAWVERSATEEVGDSDERLMSRRKWRKQRMRAIPLFHPFLTVRLLQLLLLFAATLSQRRKIALR